MLMIKAIWCVPPEVAAQLGLVPGAQVRLEPGATACACTGR